MLTLFRSLARSLCCSLACSLCISICNGFSQEFKKGTKLVFPICALTERLWYGWYWLMHPKDFQKQNTNIPHSPSSTVFDQFFHCRRFLAELVAHPLEELLILCLSLSTKPTVVFGSILTICNRTYFKYTPTNCWFHRFERLAPLLQPVHAAHRPQPKGQTKYQRG